MKCPYCKEIIDDDMQIHRIQCPIEEAIRIFREHGMESKAQLLESQGNLYVHYYKLGESIDFFYSSLLTRTGQIHLFDLIPLDGGLLLRVPSRKNPSELEPLIPQEKQLGVFREYHRWQHIMGVRNAGEVNAAIRAGRAAEIINVAEALQERKMHKMTDEIVERGAKLVLVAGPSSSGKTTTSKRLAIQMMACGLHPHTLSTDNYFVNRVDSPKDENGEYDFEHNHTVEHTYTLTHQLHCWTFVGGFGWDYNDFEVVLMLRLTAFPNVKLGVNI